MAYAERKRDFNREHIWLVELDLDYCVNTYGQAPCTASIPATGDIKCFNTAFTCQDRENYNHLPKTYRFCTNVSPLPVGIDAIPSIKGQPSISGAVADLSGGLGIRGAVSFSFFDHPDNDIGIDKYVNERTYIPYKTGTFWGKLRERNPFYVGRIMRVYSGYLVNGEFDITNFQARTYVIEKITVNRGQATVTGKDVLKLADDDRAKYPKVTTGELTADLSETGNSFILAPSGIGDKQYPANGWIRFNKEVIAFTRSGDIFTVTERGAKNTQVQDHSAGDTGQNSIRMNDRTDKLVNELLTQGANVDPVFIPSEEWAIEAESFMAVFLDGFLTEPIGVSKLLKELGENAPHYLYFDERRQFIIFTVLKEPPINASILSASDNFLSDSLTISERPELRLSNVTVNFGQFDPTQKLDEFSNYSQKYARIDLAAESPDEYGQEKIKTINSRWINNFNKGQALTVGSLIGRRFGKLLREISFTLAPKDSDFWIGQSFTANHPLLRGVTGEIAQIPFEIQQAQQVNDQFKYSALEYLYSDELPDDPESGIDLIIIGGNANNINIRDIHTTLFPTPTDETIVRVIIDSGVLVGSSSIEAYTLDTGSWPIGMASIKFIVRGISSGKGGNCLQEAVSQHGGHCLILNHDVTIEDITGILGGGGGGGGWAHPNAGGGGGAGVDVGLGLDGGRDGTALLGGLGKSYLLPGEEPELFEGGDGGDLGEKGGDAESIANWQGGNPGIAINTNGYNLVIENGAENIKGAII